MKSLHDLKLMFAFTLLPLLAFVYAREPFTCSSDICNRGDVDQFCNTVYESCWDCSEVKDECYSPKIPEKCVEWCKERDCPPIGEFFHGHYYPKSASKYGDVVTFYCKDEFELVGVKTSSCGQFGIWTSPVPFCQRKSCQSLPLLQSGHWSLKDSGNSSYTAGTRATYSCNTGYDAVGELIWLCGEHGKWVANGNAKELPLCVKRVKMSVWFVPFLVTWCFIVLCIVPFVVILCWRSKRIRNNRGNNDDESISPNGSSESSVKEDETVPLVLVGEQPPPSAPTELPLSHGDVQSYGETKKEQDTQVTVETRPCGTQTENEPLTKPSEQQVINFFNSPTITQNAETGSKERCSKCANHISTGKQVNTSTQCKLDERTTPKKTQSNGSSNFPTPESGNTSAHTGTQVKDHTVSSEIAPSTERYAPTVRLNEKLTQLEEKPHASAVDARTLNIHRHPEISDECTVIALPDRNIELSDIKGRVGTIL